MAVAAESLVLEQEQMYQLVDTIPGVAEEREYERAIGRKLLDERRATGHIDPAVPELIPVDTLSTAHKVLNAGRLYGTGSAEHQELYAGLKLDCLRLVAEWYRKKKPEFFEPLRHIYDEDSGDFFSHGLSIRQMTQNALVPISGDPEEENRRVNEYVENATPQILRRCLGGTALGGGAIRTISECTDKAIADYQFDMTRGRKHRGYSGYVPEIEKVMIRDIRLDPNSNDRFEEQVGLPGTYITHYIIQKALEEQGLPVSHMDKTGLHGAQLLARDGLLDFVARLDKVASEEWCAEIFMGEVVPRGTVKDYQAFRAEAVLRQEGLSDMAETLRTFILDLAADNVDRKKALVMVEEFVKLQLLNEVKHDAVLAEQVFDADTAVRLQEIAYLERMGRNEEAAARMVETQELAPGGGYCGGGSCGLESVNVASKEGKELAGKLRADSGDTVVKDKERSCRCGKKTVVYAYNKNKVNKYCTSCGAFESKVSK